MKVDNYLSVNTLTIFVLTSVCNVLKLVYKNDNFFAKQTSFEKGLGYFGVKIIVNFLIIDFH